MVETHACPGRLDGKVAVVTGSTHGIGLGIAKRFAREGAAVVVNDEGAYDGEAVAAALRKEGGEATYARADVADPDQVRDLVNAAVEAYDGVDVLVNNVGVRCLEHPGDVTLAEWDAVLDANLRSFWLCAKHAVPEMDGGGRVVNVSSANAVATLPGVFPYNVAKAGVDGLTRALAVEYGPRGVRVNAIRPGAIDQHNPGASDEELAQSPVRDPVGRRGRPSDVAGLAAYLASDEADFVTGATIPVDGGRHAVLSDNQYDESLRD